LLEFAPQPPHGAVVAPTDRGRLGAHSSQTIEESAVSDVGREIQMFEEFSDAVLTSETGASSVLPPLHLSLMPRNASSSGEFPNRTENALSYRNGTRKGSFIDSLQLENSIRRPSMRGTEYKSVIDPHFSKPSEPVAFTTAVEAPAAVNIDEYVPSPSQAGFLQWIRACNVGVVLASFLSLAYILNQFGRSYYSLWAAWWNGEFFGISSLNYN
jgi:hypothetical protein